MHIVYEGLKKGVTRVRKGHVIVLKIYLRVCIVQVNVKRGKICVSVMCVLGNQISLSFVVKAHIVLKLPYLWVYHNILKGVLNPGNRTWLPLRSMAKLLPRSGYSKSALSHLLSLEYCGTHQFIWIWSSLIQDSIHLEVMVNFFFICLLVVSIVRIVDFRILSPCKLYE